MGGTLRMIYQNMKITACSSNHSSHPLQWPFVKKMGNCPAGNSPHTNATDAKHRCKNIYAINSHHFVLLRRWQEFQPAELEIPTRVQQVRVNKNLRNW